MQYTDSNCSSWVFLPGVHKWERKTKESQDYKSSKVSAATYGNVPLLDTEFAVFKNVCGHIRECSLTRYRVCMGVQTGYYEGGRRRTVRLREYLLRGRASTVYTLFRAVRPEADTLSLPAAGLRFRDMRENPQPYPGICNTLTTTNNVEIL